MTTYTADDIAELFYDKHFDAWNGWIDENEWVNDIRRAAQNIAIHGGDNEGDVQDAVDAHSVLVDVRNYISENADDVDADDDAEALTVAVDDLFPVGMLKIIDNAIVGQLTAACAVFDSKREADGYKELDEALPAVRAAVAALTDVTDGEAFDEKFTELIEDAGFGHIYSNPQTGAEMMTACGGDGFWLDHDRDALVYTWYDKFTVTGDVNTISRPI